MEIQQIHNRKVVVIGAGFVGASIAYALTLRDLAREIILIDSNKEKASGEALDIQHGISYMGASAVRVGDYSDCENCDLIIITAGRNRRPGETRLDLIQDNIETMKDVSSKIKASYTRGAILVVSNPVDILTFKCAEMLDIFDGRVFGSGTMLDSSRLVRMVSDYIGLNTEVVKGNIVGEHGDSQIAIWSKMSVAGVPLDEYCDNVGIAWNDDVKLGIEKRVRELGSVIIGSKGRTHYGIATCVCLIADAVLNQRLTIAPVSSVLQGEYGISNVALSVPSILGSQGVERRLEERWTDAEYQKFKQSAENLKAFLFKR